MPTTEPKPSPAPNSCMVLAARGALQRAHRFRSRPREAGMASPPTFLDMQGLRGDGRGRQGAGGLLCQLWLSLPSCPSGRASRPGHTAGLSVGQTLCPPLCQEPQGAPGRPRGDLSIPPTWRTALACRNHLPSGAAAGSCLKPRSAGASAGEAGTWGWGGPGRAIWSARRKTVVMEAHPQARTPSDTFTGPRAPRR